MTVLQNPDGVEMLKAARKNNRVIPRLVRGTYPSTLLVQVARTSRAMTLSGWCANRFVRFRASPGLVRIGLDPGINRATNGVERWSGQARP